MKLFSLLPKRLVHLACNSPGNQKALIATGSTTPTQSAGGIPRKFRFIPGLIFAGCATMN